MGKSLLVICDESLPFELKHASSGGHAAAKTQPFANTPEEIMLWWALVFFVIAIVAAIFGFAGIASAVASVAQVIFYIALIFFVVSFLVHLFGGSGGRSRAAV